ncbi:MAG TPA: redoxin domain-containing protein, partial [Thermomicrobiales bacterium]|nr:redoxin domain-containing protein [Thermomicrobiales bacterium]
ATRPMAPNAGLPVGSTAPSIRLPDLDGRLHTLETLRMPGKPVLLVFTDANCGPCTALMPEIGGWQRDKADDVTVAVIARGDIESLRAKTAPYGVSRVLLQDDREVATAYNSTPTPSAVLVRPDGTIGGPAALGADAIRHLVTQATAPPPTAPATIPVGADAPAFALPDLDGESRSLSDFRGEDVLVAFWNPTCGFCARMLPDLTAWEQDRPDGSPRLVVVSRGEIEANRDLGFAAPVLLDQEGAVMRQFGAGGTPAGVLIDAEGKVASEVALGAPDVLKIARNEVDA